MKYYYLESLGCPKNLVDSEVFAGIIEQSGYQSTTDPSLAEVIIVNTCGFILDAKQEAIDTILTLAENKTTGVCRHLIATGCLVKRYFDDIQRDIPEIDHLINLKDFPSFAQIFKASLPWQRRQLTPQHFAYLRISDGCNNHCSYCAIPAIRGVLISDPISELIQKARSYAAGGVKELIVTAQDTTQYGFDRDGKSHLIELLIELEKIAELEWIRLLYLHPAHLSDELIDYICTSKKVCHYFEVPVQHAADHLLLDMNRKIDQQRIRQIISRIRRNDPQAAIRTTFIVGHPGETEQDYEELMSFIEEMQFDRMGVFAYSEEEGTPSADLPDKVDEDTAELRKDQLMAIQMEISKIAMSRYYKKVLRVIIDEKSEDKEFDYVGRTQYDCPDIDGVVYLYGDARPGEIRDVRIIDTWEYDLVGKILKDKDDGDNE
ncbi:MAG: 30S ribosomal protein S12 methylthiotransferase RimO [Candidatus Cloacimonetes bacterium]|nr:30S ribosomal protein S12 methylthiotransferase RimO [Candidatus Cloacimonadota bacterium]